MTRRRRHQGRHHPGRQQRPRLRRRRDFLSVHDLHATVLYIPGIDHERPACKFRDLDFELTGVEESRVVREIGG